MQINTPHYRIQPEWISIEQQLSSLMRYVQSTNFDKVPPPYNYHTLHVLGVYTYLIQHKCIITDNWMFYNISFLHMDQCMLRKTFICRFYRQMDDGRVPYIWKILGNFIKIQYKYNFITFLSKDVVTECGRIIFILNFAILRHHCR